MGNNQKTTNPDVQVGSLSHGWLIFAFLGGVAVVISLKYTESERENATKI